MSNKVPIIALIILLTIIIFGLVIFLVQYLCGANSSFINVGTKESKVICNEEFKLEDIRNIDIKQDTGNVIFKEASSDMIQVVVYGENDGDVKVNLSDGELIVDYTINHKFVLINLNIFNFKNIDSDIIVYIPSNYSNDIKIKNDLGNCEISDLENATIDVKCDAGNVDIGKIKNANIKCNLGRVKVKEILNKCNIEVDSGNLEIAKLSIKKDSKIKADLGNIDIDETNDIYIDAKVDLGKAYIENNNRNSDVTLKIECDCGNINVN